MLGVQVCPNVGFISKSLLFTFLFQLFCQISVMRLVILGLKSECGILMLETGRCSAALAAASVSRI
jgi:hypothetical protein